MSELLLRDYGEGDRAAIERVVAEDDAEVVGSYTIKPNHPGRGAHVANAGYMVAESRRGRGIGYTLGEHSIETARALGYRALQFNQVVATNETAVRLWERPGFVVIGRAPQAFRHPRAGLVDTLMMFRAL
ncbi:MAG: GNAT family N-acetyltransferase [bacterium]|nr:GNAT family N-acetyltransferase [bacterium]